MENTTAISLVRREPRQAQRYRPSKSGQTEKCATGFDGHAFLKHRFQSANIVAYRELSLRSKVEENALRSIRHFCELYHLDVPDVSELSYPQNIAAAFDRVKETFDSKGEPISLAILQSPNFATSIATIKTLPIGYDLYYIPVGQVCLMLEDPKHKRTTDLMLSLFAFLYQVVEVPFYTEPFSFLLDCYTSIRSFLEEDEENDLEYGEFATELLREMDTIENDGNSLLQQIALKERLTTFEKTTDSYKPRNKNEKKLLEACKEALDLWRKFPDCSIFNAIPDYLSEEQEENILYPNMYIGFHWGTESDWLENNINEYINNYLGECSTIQEPASTQLFHRKKKKEYHCLELQQTLIEVLEHTAQALYAFHD